MRLNILAFLAGILLLQFFPVLPGKKIMLIIFISAICILYFFAKRFRIATLVSISAFGFLYAAGYANSIHAYVLPHASEGKSIQIEGYIATIPVKMEHGTGFLFALAAPTKALLKLNWPNTSIPLHAGDKWQLTVRLKQVHGLMNPGGFDYEAWAFQNDIRANGYVVSASKNTLVESKWYRYPLTRFRENLKEKIAENLPPSNTSPWITALAIGERDNISAENWQVLRNTGTNHLMAIAGLHIGFVTSFIFFLVSWLWRRSARLVQCFPAQHAGAVCSMLAAIMYSSLAGFSVPTQRACLMVVTAFLMMLSRRRVLSWLSWSVAMLGVLLINPLSVLTDSFWLSFASVALIIYGISGRLNPTGLWWKVGRIQWVISLGLIPIGIWLFQQCSFVAFLANCIAIPMVGFLIVPLTLLGCFFLLFSAKLGGLVLLLADKVLSFLWIILTYFSHQSWGSWYLVVPQTWILLAACVGVVLLLVPAGFPGRWAGFIWILPLLFYQSPQPAKGDVWFTLLDVGQGLSSVVQTQHHILIFDAGAKLGESYDMGESVVVPFLRSMNAKKIDMLVVSHGDNDHIGGSSSILKNLPVIAVRTSVPDKITLTRASYCLQGESWQWDDVNFEFLYPTLQNLNLNNDSSCVLKITNAHQQSILLTGDIEKFAENVLLNTEQKNLSAAILVAPHHGSKTSDVNAFIDAVNPQIVLFPVGYLNRFHFPHPRVIEKYATRGTQRYRTDESGSIQFILADSISKPYLYRDMHAHYWH